MDDYISYDEKQGVLLGKETKRKLTAGDQVRVRITAVSLGRAGSSGKIGVTARQPFLGKLEWLKETAEAPVKRNKRKAKKKQSKWERNVMSEKACINCHFITKENVAQM